MRIESLGDEDAVARRAAEVIAEDARIASSERGCYLMAVSGGTTPWAMLHVLSKMNLPWPDVHLIQVDERVVAAGESRRNFTHIVENLLAHVPIPRAQVHAMPVEAVDLDQAAATYAEMLCQIAGSPPVLDLVHLGLGADGHTASLLPGDAVLGAVGDVALTDPYQGLRRMTLTFPIINRARRILWLVTGTKKAPMLARLMTVDRSIPAGCVLQQRALLLVDAAAGSGLDLPR